MKHYSDIIYSPVVTEKSMAERQNGVYTFKVCKTATKPEIKKAVEDAFNVNTKTKRRRVGRYEGTTKAYKKAIVKLQNGSSIDL